MTVGVIYFHYGIIRIIKKLRFGKVGVMKMITHIYLVRHATPSMDGNNLSQQGAMDAQKIADLVMKEAIHAVFSSPYEKSIQTVKAVAERADVQIILEDTFKERAIGNSNCDYETALSKLWGDFSFRWEGGESNASAQARGIEAMKRILNQYEGKNVVVGTHANFMALLMNYFDSKFDLTFLKSLSAPDVYQLAFNGAEITSIKRVWEDGNHN